MSLTVVGLNHRTAPVEVRERFVFDDERAADALGRLVESGAAREATLVSTCNRTELYLVLPRRPVVAPPSGTGSGPGSGTDRRAPGAGDDAGFGAGSGATAAGAAMTIGARVLAERGGMTPDEVGAYLYVREGRAAAEHLFRVVASLDSMVLGEAQIQGQVKAAYETAAAVEAGGRRVVGAVLSRLFETALSVGGRVRDRTALGAGAASVPSAAVELAKKIFGTLEGRRALVLGAGEMSELALACFGSEGIDSVIVANRTADRGERLAARAGGRAIGFEELAARLPGADIVATATAAPRPVLTRELVERALPDGAQRPLLIVDIALPRDVDPEVGAVDNVFLYDLDDLQQVVEGNLERRREEVPAAERIIMDAVEEWEAWHAARDVAPLIRALRSRAEDVRQAEVERALGKLHGLGPDEREAVETLTRRLLNKVLHRPTVRLRQAASNGGGASVVDAARYLFALDRYDDMEDEDE